MPITDIHNDPLPKIINTNIKYQVLLILWTSITNTAVVDIILAVKISIVFSSMRKGQAVIKYYILY